MRRSTTACSQSRFRVCLWGFAIGAAGPVALAIKMWHDLGAYIASVQADGHGSVCGLPAIVPIFTFVVVAPVCGLFSAAIAPGIVWLWTSCAVVPRDDDRDMPDE
ncbi:hypothetical protein Pan44_44570 [Caulifigura coniformis]|uniref:Uncharacterized protein n=1 Tax=Caulifigura coniformis TaxID=2527983 RepID=A0A517SJU6_9PLAN|nr:hypothetical protein [Caulifigura coniformis]QDT56403.1 hypothetical protein Pan44_44570 [Caulifigura coniformis]